MQPQKPYSNQTPRENFLYSAQTYNQTQQQQQQIKVDPKKEARGQRKTEMIRAPSAKPQLLPKPPDNRQPYQPFYFYENTQHSLYIDVINVRVEHSVPSKGTRTNGNEQSTPNMRISHFHTNTAPANTQCFENLHDPEQFMIKDRDTGIVYDVRQADKIQSGGKQEYLSKLKKRHKSAWQGWWQQKRDNNNALLTQTRQNNTREVEKLLDISSKDLRPEINTREDNGSTALHHASLNGNYNLALLLLKNEADCDSSNNSGQTPLIICAQRGYDSLLQLLLTIGADINHQDQSNNTAFHYACMFQHTKVAEILLARPSIQIGLRNMDNKSPADLLEYNTAIKQLIEKHLKMKKESFNQCHRIQIYDNSTRQNSNDQRIMSPSSKYYFSNQYVQSRYQSPAKLQDQNQTGQSNRSTVFINQSNFDHENAEVVGPQHIRIIMQIGRGSFGDVYLVEKRQNSGRNGPKYAMKVLPKSKFIGQNLIRYALTERNVLSMLNHPFLVKLRYAFQTNTHLCLLMDFCPGGDLSKLLSSQKKYYFLITQSRIPEPQAKLYLAEVLTALEHLHQNDIIYRDLKPENIVLDFQGHAMLTDFGLSKEGVADNYGAKSFCGSMAYLAPEMLKRVGHGRAVDWYHLGILLFEMLVGKPPFFSPNRDEMLQNIEANRMVIPDYVSKEARSLINQLLEKNPIARLGASQGDAEEVKAHPFFKNINWMDLMNRKYKMPPPDIDQELLNQKFDIPFDFILSADKSSQLNYIQGWSFINNEH